MRSAVPPEQWDALRELREGLPPTMPRLAAAARISLTSLKNQAFRHRWGNYALIAAEAGRAEDGESDDGGAGMGGADRGESGHPLPPGLSEGTAEERLARLSDMLLREVETIGVLAQARGKLPDKARIEAVGAMIRLLEKVEDFSRAKSGGGENEEVADVLHRIDARIEELARAYAKELVEGERFRAGSGADPGRVVLPGAAEPVPAGGEA